MLQVISADWRLASLVARAPESCRIPWSSVSKAPLSTQRRTLRGDIFDHWQNARRR